VRRCRVLRYRIDMDALPSTQTGTRCLSRLLERTGCSSSAALLSAEVCFCGLHCVVKSVLHAWPGPIDGTSMSFGRNPAQELRDHV
jgi:hypothetical protein